MKVSAISISCLAFLLPFSAMGQQCEAPQCQDQCNALVDCLSENDTPENAIECYTCVSQIVILDDEVDSCSTAQTRLCKIRTDCPTCAVSACSDEFNTQVTCSAQDVGGFGDCVVSCGGGGSGGGNGGGGPSGSIVTVSYAITWRAAVVALLAV